MASCCNGKQIFCCIIGYRYIDVDDKLPLSYLFIFIKVVEDVYRRKVAHLNFLWLDEAAMPL